MLQPANVATPATAAFGFAVHTNVAAPAVVIANVTELVFPVTVLPPRSCTVTTGWVERHARPSNRPGWVVNASFASRPTVIVKRCSRLAVNEPSVAVNV